MNVRLRTFAPIGTRFANPRWYLALALICQAALAAVNLQTWQLMGDTVTGALTRQALILVGAQAAMLVVTTALPLWSWRRGRELPTAVSLALLAAPAAYLALATALIPGSIDRALSWIASDDRLLLYQFMFVMPLVLHAIIRLALLPFHTTALRDLGLTLAAVMVPPGLWLAAIVGGTGLINGIRSVNGAILMALMGASVVVILLAMARLAIHLWGLARRRTDGRFLTLMHAVTGIALPLGGLALNAVISFPADFQHPAWYVIAALNGAALTLPATGRPAVDRAAALARAAGLPYVLYFFLVFLPFTPLAVPALAVFGAGVLILAPTILLVVQGRRCHGDLHRADGAIGAWRWKAAMAGAALALPLTFTGLGLAERASVMGAVAYFYEAHVDRDLRFPGSVALARRALRNLAEQQREKALPLLSDYYRWLVFDGMTLGPEKLAYLEQALSGSSPNAPLAGDWAPAPQPLTGVPTGAVIITGMRSATVVEGDLARTRVDLTLHNTGESQGEFRCVIALPAGAFIDGYWLTVGDTAVPGRIFEKKAALWVYQNIVRSLRDPGLLFYTAPGTVELRVFPFAAGEKRHTAVSILHPRRTAEPIRIGGRPLPGAGGPPAPVLAAHRGATASLLLPGAVTASLPAVRRAPYLHLIVDRSARAPWTARDIDAAIDRALALHPGITMVAVTAANYEIADITAGLRPRSALALREIRDGLSTLPRRGAFCADRAVAQALTQYRRSSADPRRSAAHYYPVIHLLTGPDRPLMGAGDLAAQARAVPECAGFWIDDGAQITARDLRGRPLRTMPAPPPVVLVRAGLSPLAVERGRDALIHVTADGAPRQLSLYDADRGGYRPALDTRPVAPGRPYAAALYADARCADMALHPWRAAALRDEALASARESGVLNPAAAYIVVEAAAHWDALARAERDRLAGRESASLAKSPEPPFWIMAMVTLCGIIILHRWRRHRYRVLQR